MADCQWDTQGPVLWTVVFLAYWAAHQHRMTRTLTLLVVLCSASPRGCMGLANRHSLHQLQISDTVVPLLLGWRPFGGHC